MNTALILMLASAFLTSCGDITVNAEQPADTNKKADPKQVEAEDKQEAAEETSEKEIKQDDQDYILVHGVDGYAYSEKKKTWFWISQEKTLWYQECPKGFGPVSVESSNGYQTAAYLALNAAYPSKKFTNNVFTNSTITGEFPDSSGTPTVLYKSHVTGKFQALYEHEVTEPALSICQKQ